MLWLAKANADKTKVYGGAVRFHSWGFFKEKKSIYSEWWFWEPSSGEVRFAFCLGCITMAQQPGRASGLGTHFTLAQYKFLKSYLFKKT